jgi:CRISPR/Cas system-associated endonuclease Cas3-HD
MNTDDNEATVIELLQKQIELNNATIEASKQEAVECSKKATECKATREAIDQQNKMVQQVLKILQKSITERTIEKSLNDLKDKIDKLINIVTNLTIITQLTGTELLRVLSRRENNVNDKKMLMDALKHLGSTKNTFELGTKIGKIKSDRDTNIEEN